MIKIIYLIKLNIKKYYCSTVDFKISNSYSSSFFHMSIRNLTSEYFCDFPLINCISNSFYRYNSISSVISVSSNAYLISGYDQPLCYILVIHNIGKFFNYWSTTTFEEGKVIKSGGTFDNNRNIVHKIN